MDDLSAVRREVAKTDFACLLLWIDACVDPMSSATKAGTCGGRSRDFSQFPWAVSVDSKTTLLRADCSVNLSRFGNLLNTPARCNRQSIAGALHVALQSPRPSRTRAPAISSISPPILDGFNSGEAPDACTFDSLPVRRIVEEPAWLSMTTLRAKTWTTSSTTMWMHRCTPTNSPAFHSGNCSGYAKYWRQNNSSLASGRQHPTLSDLDSEPQPQRGMTVVVASMERPSVNG